MKKLFLIFILFLITSFTFSSNNMAYGDDVGIKNEERANVLKELGLFKGSNKGFELDRVPTRVEGAVMLVRLLGKEDEALSGNYTHPFNNVPKWADKYIGYMYSNGLTKGVSKTKFGSKDKMSALQYSTLVLRALGYDDSKGDFKWNEAIDKGLEVNLLDNKEVIEFKNKEFLRDGIVGISFNALKTKLKGVETTLLDKLIETKSIVNGNEFKGLSPFYIRNQYGYIDKMGNIAIAPIYNDAKEFANGLAVVGIDPRQNNFYTYGYIDEKGEVVIPVKFEEADDFTYDTTSVKLEGKYYIIDKNGDFLNSIGFSNIENKDVPYEMNYLAKGKIDENKYKFINKKLGIVSEEVFEEIYVEYVLEEDSLLIVVKDGLTGYIDFKGNIVIEPQFDYGRAFSEGLAPVKVDGKWGYIDNKGKIAINPQFNNVSSFFEGLAMVEIDNKWGFIDKTGKIVIKPKYSHARPFKNGLAAVHNGSRWGYIDKLGNTAIEHKYIAADDFNGNTAYVTMYDTKYRKSTELIIDKLGNTIIENPDRVEYKDGGLILVELNDKQGIIDSSGKIIIELEYDRIRDFSEGVAAVNKDGKWGFIDINGNIISPLKYDRVDSFTNGLARVEFDRVSGEIPYKAPREHRDNIGIECKLSYINKSDNMIMKPKKITYIQKDYYRKDSMWVRVFKPDLEIFIKDNKYGFIDKYGEVVIEPIFEYAEPFYTPDHKETMVQINGQKRIINRDGEFIK